MAGLEPNRLAELRHRLVSSALANEHLRQVVMRSGGSLVRAGSPAISGQWPLVLSEAIRATPR